ncbi:hypothetical protein EDC01DRAFT_727848 [Geopyxis carbonaria]|nr:hypothetical protein EDC01DRAFT_727848 [Geopyxis carbonaria]
MFLQHVIPFLIFTPAFTVAMPANDYPIEAQLLRSQPDLSAVGWGLLTLHCPVQSNACTSASTPTCCPWGTTCNQGGSCCRPNEDCTKAPQGCAKRDWNLWQDPNGIKSPFCCSDGQKGYINGNGEPECGGNEIQSGGGSEIQSGGGNEIQSDRGSEIQSDRGSEIQSSRGSETQSDRNGPVQTGTTTHRMADTTNTGSFATDAAGARVSASPLDASSPAISGGAIAGIIISVLVLLALILLAVFLLRRKRRNTASPHPEGVLQDQETREPVRADYKTNDPYAQSVVSLSSWHIGLSAPAGMQRGGSRRSQLSAVSNLTTETEAASGAGGSVGRR